MKRPKLYIAKEEHTACPKMSKGKRAKFKQNFSVTDALQSARTVPL